MVKFIYVYYMLNTGVDCLLLVSINFCIHSTGHFHQNCPISTPSLSHGIVCFFIRLEPPPQQQRYNSQWEKWEENSDGQQAHNLRSNTSSLDWSQCSSEHQYNYKWEDWDVENQFSHLSYHQKDESHNSFGNSRPSTFSSDWSAHSSEQNYNSQWEHWAIESFDRDSHLSHLTGDEDYNPSQNSRLRPGPSYHRSISRESSTRPQNQNDQKIHMSPCTWFFFKLLAYFHTIQHLIF